MADPLVSPCVLVVADSDRLAELVTALSELHNVDVMVSSGGDDTIDLFEARRPAVIVLTASLQLGEPKSLIVTLRGMVPRGEVAIVVIGDDAGPIRTALDALDLAPDRFVTRPLSAKALRFAVTGGIDAVRLARSGLAPRSAPPGAGTSSGRIELVSGPASALRRVPSSPATTASAVTPVISATMPSATRSAATRVAGLAPVAHSAPSAVTRVASLAPTAPAGPAAPAAPAAPAPEIPGITLLAAAAPASLANTSSSVTPVAAAGPSAPAVPMTPVAAPPATASSVALGTGTVVTTRAVLRARWEALADSILEAGDDEDAERAVGGAEGGAEGGTEEAQPAERAEAHTRTAHPAERVDTPADAASRARAELLEVWRAVEQAQAEAEAEQRAARGASTAQADAAWQRSEQLAPVIGERVVAIAAAEPAQSVVAEPARAVAPERAEPAVAESAQAVVAESAQAVVAEPAQAVVAARAEPVVAEPVVAEPAQAEAAESAEPGVAEPAEPAQAAAAAPTAAQRAEPAQAATAAPTAAQRAEPGEPPPAFAAVAEPPATPIEREPALADGGAWRAAGVTPIERPGHSMPADTGSLERPERARIIDRPWDPESPAPAEPGRAAAPRTSSGEPVLPPPLVIKPRRHQTGPVPVDDVPSAPWSPASSEALPAPREPTLILRDPAPAPAPAEARTRTGDVRVVVAARTSSQELWSEPMPIPALVEREPRNEAEGAAGARDELGLPLDDLDDDDLITSAREPAAPDGVIVESPDARQSGPTAVPESRDFARELRAKMSMMAQRLFQGGGAPAADHAPRHDHHAEIDLASLGDEPSLGGGITEIEARAQRQALRDVVTSPGSWDTQVRERGLPDAGAIVRGVSDAAMLLARMFAQGATGRVGFRRDEVETIVYFDHGRPVFASSNEPRDRMGELLLREGKITASQYERCQTVVAESGRRMGEILVDLGYLKRRELLPAVRRHVEDLVYSLFGWDRGTYFVALDDQPCAERIRLSRHPAALILEGIRRKLDRTNLERLIGPPSTVIEVRDRERLGGIVNMGDLAPEERGALAAFDGQADLAQVARAAGVDIADVLPLAWGLCVLGLATARRTDTEILDETTALVGETDLAIDRERVRARWQLVTEADYFALLGVRRDATGFEIRRAYQSARRDFAADCFPGDLRRELARELDDIAHVLDEAYRVLRDDRLRQAYLANLVDS